MKILLRLLVATGLSGAFAAAESFQWTNPSGGNWSDPNNWTPSQVPSSGDTASIPGGGLAIVIDTTVSISGLSLSGGSGLNVAVGGVFNILGNVNLFGPLTNAGTVNWQDGQISVYNHSYYGYSGAITNQAGGLFDIRCDQTIYPIYGSGQFHNAGTLRKSAGTGNTEFSVYFDNSGAVEGRTGLLRFNYGTNLGGTFQAATNAVVDIAGNDLTLSSTPPFQGPGTVRITTPNVAMDNFSGSVDLTGANISGQITAGSVLNLHGGNVTNSGLSVAVGGVFNILGNVNLFGPLTNAGTVNWQDGQISVYNYSSYGYSGAITNQAGGLFDIRCDQTIYPIYGSGQFHNAGTLRKSAGTGNTEFSVYFDNSGAVEGRTGLLRFNGGTNLGGTFQAATDAVVDIAGNDLTLSSTPPFQGPGTVRITTPNVAMDNFSGSVDLTGANISGQITAGSVLNLHGGNVTNSGLSVAVGGVFNILGNVTLWGSLTNAGTVNWQDGQISVAGNYGGEIINQAGGLFDIRCDQTVYPPYGFGQFHNAGTLRKSAGTGNTEFSVYFDNSGAVEGRTGLLRFNGGTNLGGTFQAATDAVVDIAGSNLTLSSTPPFQGPGTVRITTPNVTMDNFSGSVDLTGANVSGQITAGSILNLHGGTVTNSGLNVAVGGVFNILGNVTLWGSLTNAGTVNWQDGQISVAGNYGGEIINQAGGLFDIRCDQTVYPPYGFGQFHNAGTLRKSAGTGNTEFSVYFDNSGAVEGRTGLLRFNYGYSGELFVTLSQDMTGRIWIGGNSPVSLAGKFTVRMESGYRPNPGDIFPVLNYPGAIGDFTCLNGLDLGHGLRLEPRFDGEGLTLVATAYEETPIPALNIIRANSGVFISWPVAISGWELYRGTDLATWQASGVAGENNTVMPIAEAREFFRLQKP